MPGEAVACGSSQAADQAAAATRVTAVTTLAPSPAEPLGNSWKSLFNSHRCRPHYYASHHFFLEEKVAA